MFRFIVPNYAPALRSENPTSRPANDDKQPRPDGMSEDAYRRVGRGGAGNFYSKKDVEDVEKASKAARDLEAQKMDPSPLDEAAPAAQYSRAGRGGAGNFYEGGAGSSDDSAEARKVQALVGASLAQPKQGGHGGRGGMGNWSDGASAPAQGDERARMSQLQAKILKDVDAGLAPPPKTYHQSDRDVE